VSGVWCVGVGQCGEECVYVVVLQFNVFPLNSDIRCVSVCVFVCVCWAVVVRRDGESEQRERKKERERECVCE